MALDRQYNNLSHVANEEAGMQHRPGIVYN